MTEQISVNLEEGAAMLGVSVTIFRENVAPFVPAADYAKPGARSRIPRWLVADLRTFAEQRRGRAA